jgi:hypothetical protein
MALGGLKIVWQLACLAICAVLLYFFLTTSHRL